jgi:hypothetical protein
VSLGGTPAALRVARDSLGPLNEWLTVDEAAGAETDGLSTGDLLAGGGAGIDRVLERWREARPGDPGGPPAVLGSVAWALYLPRLLTVRDRRLLIRHDPHEVRFELAGEDEPTRVWWPATAVDPVTGDGGAVEAYRFLVEEAVSALGPLVEAVRARHRCGRRGLWAHVVDVFNMVGPRYDQPDPAPRCTELRLMRQARAGTPLDQPVALVDVERPDGRREMIRTSACCLAYLVPLQPGGESRPWHGGPWERYCMRCPLIPVEESVARAHYWLDREAP